MNLRNTYTSPNYDERRGHVAPHLVILHHTGMIDAKAALERLCDQNAKVSAHYVVDEDGTIYRLVPEDKRAWHAGVGYWQGLTDINSHSIGIELVNPGHECGYRIFPATQIAAVTDLCKMLKARYNMPAQNFLGHSDIAPLRKCDPGELFPWAELANQGIGLWPDKAFVTGNSLELLSAIGYGPLENFTDEQALKKIILAFQRHFLPTHLTGNIDEKTAERIGQIAALSAKA